LVLFLKNASSLQDQNLPDRYKRHFLGAFSKYQVAITEKYMKDPIGLLRGLGYFPNAGLWPKPKSGLLFEA
jgi:hypothetical protein